MRKHCCKKFKSEAQSRHIKRGWCVKEEKKKCFTRDFAIDYCPFCGIKLEED